MVIYSCVLDPIENDNILECEVDSFIGEWEYHSTDGVVLDSIPDLLIELSDNDLLGDILINENYLNIKTIQGCTAGNFSGIIDINYELISSDQISRRASYFYAFGSTDLYTKKK